MSKLLITEIVSSGQSEFSTVIPQSANYWLDLLLQTTQSTGSEVTADDQDRLITAYLASEARKATSNPPIRGVGSKLIR